MIIKTVKANEIPKARIKVDAKIKRVLIEETIENFKRSSARNIEVIDDEGLWANSNNFRRSFQNYIDHHEIESIQVTIRGNRVFFIKGIYSN